MSFLIIFLGGGLGAALRHGVNLLADRMIVSSFPFGTLTINVLGSTLMGVIVGYFALKGETSQHWRLFLTTGALGGFTTFSTFSLEAVLLYERGATAAATLYVAASVGLSVAGLITGLWLLRQFS